jgi:hypothetical protein
MYADSYKHGHFTHLVVCLYKPTSKNGSASSEVTTGHTYMGNPTNMFTQYAQFHWQTIMLAELSSQWFRH